MKAERPEARANNFQQRGGWQVPISEDEIKQLSARVAVEIMGEPMPPAPIGCNMPITSILSPRKAWVHVHDWEHGDECEWVPTGFAEHIGSAVKVVERLRSLGCWTWIRTFIHTTQVNVEMGIPSSECQEWGETMPEAICRCALKAKEKFNLP